MLLAKVATSLTEGMHLMSLLNFLISSYFLQLKTVLIVHNSSECSELQRGYLNSLQLAFNNQSNHELVTALLWLDVASLQQSEFDERILRSVDFAIEGFITILPNTSQFLHARYYATRSSMLRLRDKFYLFLCEEHEKPSDFLAIEILQFYPHHLLVTPQPRQTQNETETSNKHPSNENISIKKVPRERNLPISSAKSSAILSSTMQSLPLSTETKIRDIIFELWTQKFVGATGNLNPVLLDAFLANKTFIRNAELYPNKLLDLKGRKLKVGSLTYIPYAVTNYVPPGTGNIDSIHSDEGALNVLWIGSEAQLMLTFCEIQRCHLRVKPYGPDNWGGIYTNGTSSGLLRGIYTQSVEFAIGCIYDWYPNLTETSNTIARSAVTILGPAPSLSVPWYTNIAPFTQLLWTLVLITMAMFTLTLYFIRVSYIGVFKYENEKVQIERHLKIFRDSNIDVMAAFLQQPSISSNEHLAVRVLMTVLFFAGITLESTYSGQLKSILTIPLYSEAVDTSDKWIKTDWKWAAPDAIWTEALWSSALYKDKKIQDLFETSDHNTLFKRSFRYDYGLGVERLQSGVFSFGKYLTSQAMNTKIVLKDDLYYDYTRAVSIRGSPIMPLFNRHVRICMESGLFEQWERETVEKFLNRKTQEMMMDSITGQRSKSPPRPLSIVNITGALFSLLFGCVLSTIAFGVEIFEHTLSSRLFKTNKY